MKRQQIAAGNWKMNTTLKEGVRLASAIAKNTKTGDALVILGTPFTHLASVKQVIKSNKRVKLAAQNCYEKESGAFTGAISIDMIKSTGADYVILGHSERRAIFGETDKLIAQKVDLVLSRKLKPIFCCGEPLDVRKSKKHKTLVSQQVRKGLFHLSEADFKKVVIAYEPVWAIGTGVTASPAQAQEMHAHIRKIVAKKYGDKIANKVTILYGGSVKPANAKELFSQTDVDGGLVGGASLDAKGFGHIINSF